MNVENDSLPGMDDNQVDGQTEQELLDAVLASTSFLHDEERPGAEVPLPEEEVDEVDPADSEDEDPESDEEVVSEDEEEVVEEDEDEAEGEDDEHSTQEPDVFTADDLDLEAKVRVKVDGEELDVSFADLLKGYQTDAHLSKKGRELGEIQAAIEAERTEKLALIDEMGTGMNAMMQQNERALAKQYHDLEAKIEKAREEGDTYEVGELKDKREQVQKKYHNAKKQREGLMSQVAQAKQQQATEQHVQQLQYFQQEIPNLIPNFDEKVASDIRDFALDTGIDEAVVDSIMDPKVIYALYDYMNLKKGVAKGAAKRKAVPAKKAVPTKKPTSAKKKAQDKEKMVKARAFREDASKDDQMAFLRQYANESLNR